MVLAMRIMLSLVKVHIIIEQNAIFFHDNSLFYFMYLVVMKWERSNDGDYIWKNVVIPNWSLTMTTRFQAGKTTEEKSSPITYLVGFNAVLRVSCI